MQAVGPACCGRWASEAEFRRPSGQVEGWPWDPQLPTAGWTAGALSVGTGKPWTIAEFRVPSTHCFSRSALENKAPWEGWVSLAPSSWSLRVSGDAARAAADPLVQGQAPGAVGAIGFPSSLGESFQDVKAK